MTTSDGRGVDTAVVRVMLRRDLGAIVRSKALILPMMLLPLMLLVVLPASIGLAANGRTLSVDRFLAMLPGRLAEPVLAHPPDERLVMHRFFLPTWLWMIVIVWLAPAVAALGVGIMVRVSIRVNNTQEAQQLGGAVVLPLVILAVGQTTTLMLSGARAAFLTGVAIWAVAIFLNVRGAASFTRERMATRL